MNGEREENLVQIPQDYKQNVSQAFMDRADRGLIEFFQDLKDILYEVENILKGKVPEYAINKIDGRVVINDFRQLDKPLLNDKGVSWVMLNLYSRLNKGIFMSNYDEDQINDRAMRCKQIIIDGLFENKEEFNVKTISDYFTIIGIIDDNVFSALRRALRGDEKTFLCSVYEGDAQWSRLGLPDAQHLPAVRWKLANIAKMDEAKRQSSLRALKAVLGGE